MFKEIKEGFLFTLVTLVLFGVVYPLLVWGVGQVLFSRKAEGSFIRKADGTIAGLGARGAGLHPPRVLSRAGPPVSTTTPPRPEERTTVHRIPITWPPSRNARRPSSRGKAFPSTRFRRTWSRRRGAVSTRTSLPEAALIQVERVARERGVSAERVRELVEAHTDGPTFGFLGRPRVHVLKLNLALDSEEIKP